MIREVQAERATPAELRQVCAELERRLSAGEAFSAEDLFASHPELSDDADAALEVIYTEFVARERLGQKPAPDSFFSARVSRHFARAWNSCSKSTASPAASAPSFPQARMAHRFPMPRACGF